MFALNMNKNINDMDIFLTGKCHHTHHWEGTRDEIVKLSDQKFLFWVGVSQSTRS